MTAPSHDDRTAEALITQAAAVQSVAKELLAVIGTVQDSDWFQERVTTLIDATADYIETLQTMLTETSEAHDAAVGALDELAAWVGYGDWHQASVELACKVRAVLGERNYLPRYDCEDAAANTDGA